MMASTLGIDARHSHAEEAKEMLSNVEVSVGDLLHSSKDSGKAEIAKNFVFGEVLTTSEDLDNYSGLGLFPSTQVRYCNGEVGPEPHLYKVVMFREFFLACLPSTNTQLHHQTICKDKKLSCITSRQQYCRYSLLDIGYLGT